MKNKLKASNGITLVALVVTIVVLLILAAVAITKLTGDNNIINKSQEAGNKLTEAEQNEQKILTDMARILNENTKAEPTELIYVTLYTDGTLVFSDNEQKVPDKTVNKEYNISKNTPEETPWLENVGNIKK